MWFLLDSTVPNRLHNMYFEFLNIYEVTKFISILFFLLLDHNNVINICSGDHFFSQIVWVQFAHFSHRFCKRRLRKINSILWKYDFFPVKLIELNIFYILHTLYPRFRKNGITSVRQETIPTVHLPTFPRFSTVSINFAPYPCFWNSGRTAIGPISIIPLCATALMHPSTYVGLKII